MTHKDRYPNPLATVNQVALERARLQYPNRGFASARTSYGVALTPTRIRYIVHVYEGDTWIPVEVTAQITQLEEVAAWPHLPDSLPMGVETP